MQKPVREKKKAKEVKFHLSKSKEFRDRPQLHILRVKSHELLRYISLPSLHVYDVKLPNSRFVGNVNLNVDQFFFQSLPTLKAG